MVAFAKVVATDVVDAVTSERQRSRDRDDLAIAARLLDQARPLVLEAVERISAVEAVIDLRNFAIPAVMEAFRSIFAIADALGSLGEDAAPKDEDAAPKRVAA